MADIKMKKGDRFPSVTATLRSNGVPVNLTGASVFFGMRPKNGGAVKINYVACTIVTPLSGIVRFDWGGAHTDTVGLFHADFLVEFSGLNPTTYPNGRDLTVEILPRSA